MSNPNPDARDKIIAYFEDRVTTLSQQRAKGDIQPIDFQITMRQELRDSFAMQLIAGNGGPLDDPSDYLKLGSVLKAQYRFLESFTHDIIDGEVTGDGIANRAALYARASRQMYWRQAMGHADLPAFPGDGSSECGANDKCQWVDNGDGSYTWLLDKEAHNCDTCIQRSEDWNPYWPDAAEDDEEKAFNPDQPRDARGRWFGIEGGAYRDIRPEGGEVHHAPAETTYITNPNRKKGEKAEYLVHPDMAPAWRMEKKDHEHTASYGPSAEAQAYRDKQAALIMAGRFSEAQQMDIDDTRSLFGSKYDSQINDALKYTAKMIKFDDAGLPINVTAEAARQHRDSIKPQKEMTLND